jgi:hypothetical protein
VDSSDLLGGVRDAERDRLKPFLSELLVWARPLVSYLSEYSSEHKGPLSAQLAAVTEGHVIVLQVETKLVNGDEQATVKTCTVPIHNIRFVEWTTAFKCSLWGSEPQQVETFSLKVHLARDVSFIGSELELSERQWYEEDERRQRLHSFAEALTRLSSGLNSRKKQGTND